jgi:tetratricopeptide (TPR) repeat protein
MFDCHIVTYNLSKAASKLLPLTACACLAGNLVAQDQPPVDSAASTVQAGISEQQSTTSPKQSPANLNTSEFNSIREYEEQVHQLKSRYDAYHPGLSEAMTGLALAHQQEGNHEEAISSLETALQINRVNYGLHSVNKIPLIEHLIVSYAATRNWQAVEDRYYTLMQLYSRNYNKNDLELLPGLSKLIKWHLQAFNEKVTEQPVANLLMARELIFQTINIIRSNYGVEDLRQLDPFTALLLIDFYIAVEQQEVGNEVRKPVFNSFRDETNPAYIESGGMHMSMLSQGRQHIEAMIQITQIHAATHPKMAVDTLVMLADWNLLFKQKMAADEIYRQVWEQAMKLDDHERHIEEIFNQPVRLPRFHVEDTKISNASPSEKGVENAAQDTGGNTGGDTDWNPDGNTEGNTDGQGAIVFEFDISTSGRALDPELVTADPGASKEIISRARRQLRSSRFRPRYENGIAVENQKVRIRYLFEPEPEPEPESAPEPDTEPSVAEASNEE